MKLYDIARLYRVRLKGRSILTQETLAVLGISVGVALLFASQVASTSLNDSVAQLTNGIVGHAQYQLKSRSMQGFDERLLNEAQRLPGVEFAIPVLEQGISLIGPKGRRPVDLLATDPQDVHLAGALLQSFTPQRLKRRLLPMLQRLIDSSSLADRRVIGSLTAGKLLVLPEGVARSVGARSLGMIKVQVGARIASAVLTTTAAASELGPLAGSQVVGAPLAYAQQLTGMGAKLTRILVRAKTGRGLQVRSELRKLAGAGQSVEPANFDATVFRQAATPVNQSTGTFAAICALVGFMFAFCSMLLGAPTRQRLVSELHLLGAPRRTILEALLFDALILGVLACLIGLVLGDVISRLLFSTDPGFLTVAFPVASQRIITWHSVVLAVAAGLLSACVGVLAPLRVPGSGLRLPTARKRHVPASPTGSLLGGGVACLGATTAVLLAAPGSAILAIATLVLALLLLLPLMIDVQLKTFQRLQRLAGSGASMLALLELRAPTRRMRSIAIAATAAVAVFGSVTIAGSRANLQTGLRRSFHDITSASDLWVVPSGSQSLVGTVPFEGLPTRRIAQLPGVRAVGIYRSSFLDIGDRRVWVIAPSPTAMQPLPPSQLVAGAEMTTNARLRAGGWVVVSQALAGALHLHIGQRFTLPSPSPMSLRVAALSTNLGWSPGAVMLNTQDYVRAWGNSDPTAYNIILSRGATQSAVKREISRLLASAGLAGLSVQSAAERERAQTALARQGLTRLTQMTLLALIAGILATAASVAAVISQRRRQVARLKVQGFPRRVLWAALVWEGTLLIGAGCLAGTLFGIYGQLLLSHALISVTGFPVVLSIRVEVAIESLVAVTLAAAGVIAIPGYLTASVRPHPRL